MKKILSLVLAVMMIAVVGLAGAEQINNGNTSAAPNLGNGTNAEKGVAGTWTKKDTPIVQNQKSIILKKEITVYNPNESLIYGPEIKYTYTIAPAPDSDLKKVTDAETDHVSGLATTVTTLGASAITSGTPTVTGQDNDGTTTNQIRWLNTDILDASATGTPNYKNLTIDFSNVVFSQPGVYRYKITESVDAYTTSGVTAGNIAHTRYLDVYVMRSSSYSEATKNTSAAWSIYGFVCIGSDNLADLTPNSEVKTIGFVDGDTPESETSKADEYHTYNLTVGKTLIGDNTMSTHQFPFDVAFSNGTDGTATETFRFAVKTNGNASITQNLNKNAAGTSVNNTTVAAESLNYTTGSDVVTTEHKDGDPTIAHNATVTYIGIPNTITATVTETNDVTGTTYTTRVYANTWTTSYTAPTTQVGFTGGNSAKGDENSITNALATTDWNDTAVYAQTAAPTIDTNQAILFTNTLAIISPTGYVSRVAPYALMLAAGAILLVLGFKRRTKKEEA